MSRFDRAGISFSYLDRGSGPPLVLQHGLGGDSTQADQTYRARGRLVCLECRGHGATRPLGPVDQLTFATFAADVVALLAELGLDRVDIAGVSMGAGVALRIAAARPSLVRRLVLVRPAWVGRDPENLVLFKAAADLLEAFGPVEGKKRLRRDPRFARLRAASAWAATSLLAQFDRPDAVERAPVLRAMTIDSPLPEPRLWAAMRTPTLVVATRDDPIHPHAVARAIADRLPNCALETVVAKGVDDDCHVDQVTEAIERFRRQPARDLTAPRRTEKVVTEP